MGQKSLPTLVGIYRHEFAPRISEYLDYFHGLESLEHAIHFACHGREGKIHDHQRRVGKTILEQARQRLQESADEIRACRSFDVLIRLVEELTLGIDRFGVLAVYDTSLRLGAHLGKWPELVYLHAGTKKGCRALGVAANGRSVELGALPEPLQSLEPYQAEDFLCVFKDELSGISGKPKGC